MPLVTIFLIILVDLLGFGIVLPLLPFYATRFGAEPLAVGLLFSIYSLAQLFCSPMWGGLSDRWGRRPVMLLTTLGGATAYVIFGLAPSLLILFLSRLAAGVMAGNIATAQAYVADVTSPKERARGMGLIGAAFGLGFMLGPALASLLLRVDISRMLPGLSSYALPIFFAAMLSFISFLLVLFRLPETVKAPLSSPSRPSVFKTRFWKLFLERDTASGSRIFALLLFSAFLLTFSQSSLYGSFPLYCRSILELSADRVGLLYAFMGFIAVVVQGGLIRRLTHVFGETRLITSGCMIGAMGFFSIPFATSLGWVLLPLGIMTLGVSLATPALHSLISKQAQGHQVGAAMGMSQSMASLGRVLGPSWGGWLYGLAVNWPFTVTAFVLLLAVGISFKIKTFSTQKKSPLLRLP
jgi:MFS transporter, DHA1 family, tetracycline resistance protein